MTSSPGTLPPPYEAVVQRGEQGLGPVRLPLAEQRRFIDEFNQRYGPMGISVSRIVSASPPPSGPDDDGQGSRSNPFTTEC